MILDMEKLLAFMRSKKLMVIASHDAKDVWVTNLYIGVDAKGLIYFISPEDTKHSLMIRKNPHVAFSIAWFDETNPKNRKAVQGLGDCRSAESEEEVAMGVKLHNQNFPEFKEHITIEWIRNNEWASHVWVLKPTYVKYWDDEIYGDDGSEEFFLNEQLK